MSNFAAKIAVMGKPLVDKDYQLAKTGSWTFVEIPEIVMPKPNRPK